MKNKRKITIGSFDLIKGIGIILVILVHTFGDVSYDQSMGLSLIRSVVWLMKDACMPMFFMISGFGFKEKSPKKMLKKTFSDLIIPYLWVMAAYAVIFPLTHHRLAFDSHWNLTIESTIQYAVAFILGISVYEANVFGYEVAWCTAAWYLLAAFTAFNILNLIVRIKRRSLQICLVVLSAFIGGALFDLNFYFYCIPHGLIAMTYCYIGYAIRKRNLFETIQSSVWTYVILIPAYLFHLKFGSFDLASAEFNHKMLDYIGAGCGGALLMLAGVFLGQIKWRGLDWINQIGMYTYWIFAIHAAEMEALPWWYFSWPPAMKQWHIFTSELILKTVLFIIGCLMLKRISKYKYQRKIASSKTTYT